MLTSRANLLSVSWLLNDGSSESRDGVDTACFPARSPQLSFTLRFFEQTTIHYKSVHFFVFGLKVTASKNLSLIDIICSDTFICQGYAVSAPFFSEMYYHLFTKR